MKALTGVPVDRPVRWSWYASVIPQLLVRVKVNEKELLLNHMSRNMYTCMQLRHVHTTPGTGVWAAQGRGRAKRDHLALLSFINTSTS